MIVAISPSSPAGRWVDSLNDLFRAGLSRLHLRFPHAEDMQEYAQVIHRVDANFHNRIMVCAFPALLDHFDLAGLYYRAAEAQKLRPTDVAHLRAFAVGAHSLQELQALQVCPSYALLSPVFDSISKEGYKGNPALGHIRQGLQALPFPVVALGGIKASNQAAALALGYDGVALMGGLWQGGLSPLEAFSHFTRPRVVSVAGLDPCAGAGLLADARTAQALDADCYAIPSCLTVQNPKEFVSATATSGDYQAQALQTLLETLPASVAKIGMMPSLESVRQTAQRLKHHGIKTIVWDPVLHATHARGGESLLQKGPALEEILHLVSLVTPNREEYAALFGALDDEHGAKTLSQQHHCAILLKGGHDTREANLVTNILFREGEALRFTSHRYAHEVHGSGCMLSSAIAALVAHGNPLPVAVEKALHYMEGVFRHQGGASASALSAVRMRRSVVAQCGRLQYITNSADEATILAHAQAFLEGGGRWVQLRMKEATTARRIAVGLKLHALCQHHNAVLVVDDDLEATKAIGAEGVHIGPTDCSPQAARRLLGPHYLIGYTVNDLPNLQVAGSSSADYVGLGPYRYTTTKANPAAPLGLKKTALLADTLDDLRASACGHASCYKVAIGGIEVKDVEALLERGHVDGVAVSGAIARSRDIRATTRQLVEALAGIPQEGEKEVAAPQVDAGRTVRQGL